MNMLFNAGTRARILVTGGAGFIGSATVRALIDIGHSVTVIDDLSTGLRESVSEPATLIIETVTNFDLVNDAIAESDACIHLAAIASVQRCNTAWTESHGVNQSAFVALLEAVARRPGGPIPVVYASSAAVYGNASGFPISENASTKPLSIYGADKLGCELHARAAARVGVPSFGLRLYNVYGTDQRAISSYSGVISIFVDRALKCQPLTIYGEGSQSRDFIHIDDVVSYIIAALGLASTDSPICNIGTGVETSVLDLARILRRALNSPACIQFEAGRQVDVFRSVADTSLAEKIFQKKPQISLWKGLQRFVQPPSSR